MAAAFAGSEVETFQVKELPPPPEYETVPPVPKLTEEPSVPVKVRVLLAVRVFPSATAKVELEAGAVTAILLIEVTEAAPRVGVTRVGLVTRTTAPVPETAEMEVPLILKAFPLPAVS